MRQARSSAQPLPYTIHILIIDDNPGDARLAKEQLTWALPDREQVRRASGERVYCAYEFVITSFTPRGGESQREFTDRFERYLRGEKKARRNIHVVLIDALFGLESSPQGAEFGKDIAKRFRRLSPTTVRCLLTSYAPGKVNDPLYDLRNQKVDLDSHPEDVANDILVQIQMRMNTPLWDALREYANKTKIVMHAMALTNAKAIGPSPLIKDLVDFLSIDVLRAEASLTLPPLDSLLGPGGSIKKAQDLFASAFGANHAYFCTNGTSTANKIVSETLLGPDDVVFLDRNCHISHHYAYMLGSYRPYFLNPWVDWVHGLPLTITPLDLYEQTDTYLRRIKDLGADPLPLLPKLVVITNCSFDGHLVRPNEIIESYLRALTNHNLQAHFARTAFLFDEAWFGFGRFHPELIEFTATGADYSKVREKAGCVRVYATTSVHKTMSSMRQASVILELDDEAQEKHPRSKELMVKFRQAFNCHTTTSPHAAILATMDVARRQMAFDGYELLDEAIRCAREFRSRVGKWTQDVHPAAKYFALIEEGRYETLSAKPSAACASDPTKVTLLTTSSISGHLLKTMLWENQQIQVNKFGTHSVLLMFMIGSTDTLVENLATALEKLAEQLDADEIGGSISFEEPNLRKEPMIRKFVDANGLPGEYPEDLLTRGIGAREAIFSEGFGRYVHLDPGSKDDLQALEREGTVVSACFVTPYPPGFPIIVPGEIISEESLIRIRPFLSGDVLGLVSGKKPNPEVRFLPVRVLPAP